MSTPQSPVEPASPAASAPRESSFRELTSGSAGVLMLLVLVFACYAKTSASSYIWDDDAYVTGNVTLRTFGGLSQIWTDLGATPQYYPITFTSFWIEHQLFGLKPGLSHIINALLHAGSALLLWKILRRLAVPGAWVAAAIFAVHPMQVESVAWIAERKNTLSVLLALAAAWMYFRYARIGTDEQTAPAGEGIRVALPDDPKRLYRLFLVLFTMAILAKTAVAVLPVMLAVVIWWQRGRITKADILSLLPAVVLGVIAGSVTSYIEHNPDFVGASGVEWDIPIVQRVMLVGQTAAFYAYKILWPFAIKHFGDVRNSSIPFFPISFNYERWTLNAKSPLQWLPLVALLGTLAGLALHWKKTGRRGPLTSAGLFLIALLPVSGLFMFFPMRFSWVADHFAYLASIGLITGVVAGATVLLQRVQNVTGGLAAVLIAGMMGVTFWHTTAFTDLPTLWSRTIQQNPRSWQAAVSYGVTLMNRANLESGALAAGGDYDSAAERRAFVRDAAEKWMKEGIRLNPNAYEGYRSLGALAVQRGKVDDAIGYYKQAEQAAADMRAVGYRLPAFYIGDLLISQGKIDEGLAIFTKLEELEPRLGKRAGGLFAQIHTKRGDILRGRIKSPVTDASLPEADAALLAETIEQYDAAITVGPDYIPPKIKLAKILLDRGVFTEAVRQLQDTVKLDPNNLDAKVLTAQVASKQGRYDLAVAQLENLIQVYPTFLPAYTERAKALRTMGRTEQAKAGLEAALQDYPNAMPLRKLLVEMGGTPPATRPSATAPTTEPFGPADSTPGGQ